MILGREGYYVAPIDTLFKEQTTMDRNTPMSSGKDRNTNSSDANVKVDNAARAAHATTDRVADAAAAQVDRLSGTAHRAVDGAADTARTATNWASGVADQASEMRTKAVESASDAIRQQPLAIVAGALVIGYLIGRL
jgi:ElaB/YqjD/DUF883 family membrane-anchored ribosome-binding protein